MEPSAPDAARAAPSYSNELPGFALRDGSRWASLRPLESTMADVRRVMGPPSEARDIANYSAAYAGDEAAVAPVWTYAADAEWELLVYFVKSNASMKERASAPLHDRLLSIDLVPRHERVFDVSQLPRRFAMTHVDAADGAWDEFSDGSGLVYAISSRNPPKERIIDRIVYGPSDAQLRRYGLAPSAR